MYIKTSHLKFVLIMKQMKTMEPDIYKPGINENKSLLNNEYLTRRGNQNCQERINLKI